MVPTEEVSELMLDQIKQQRNRLDNPAFENLDPYQHLCGSVADLDNIELWPVETPQRPDASIAPKWPNWSSATMTSQSGFKVVIYPLTTKANSWAPSEGSVNSEFVVAKLAKCGIEPPQLPVCVNTRRFRNWSECYAALLVWKDSVHAMYAIWRMWNLKTFVPKSVAPSQFVFVNIRSGCIEEYLADFGT